MSLALVQVPVSDFHTIFDHVSTHYARYRNMHLRKPCQRKGQRDLRYLHAMYASTVKDEIEGMISGPNIFWHYRLTLLASGRTQLSVLAHASSAAESARIQRQFLPDILSRIEEEDAGSDHYPKRTKGQYYLRRGQPGSSATHLACQAAVATGVLDKRFVAQLRAWNLRLLCP